jgi:integrase
MALRRLAVKAAVDRYISKSVAPATMRGYKREWIRWLKFAREQGYRLAPPRIPDLEDYLVSVVAARKSVSVLDAVSASFNWHCAEVGAESPFGNRRVALLVKGMRSSFRKPVVPRLPFERAHIRSFMRRAKESHCHCRAAVVMAVCFTDFLRFSEVANVKLEDVTVSDKRDMVRFKVRKAKNHRMGFDVSLPVSARRRCVGAFVLDYLERGLQWRRGDFGFLCCKVQGKRFTPRVGVSYTTLHSSCKDLIKSAGLDPSKYSTHSAKRGGATAAVAAGCSDAEVTSLGRWRSANTGRQYVHAGPEFRNNLRDRFSV